MSDVNVRVVSQKSGIGKIALEALARYFAGPNCDLSDLNVRVEQLERGYQISLGVLDCFIGEKDRFYDSFVAYFGKERVSG